MRNLMWRRNLTSKTLRNANLIVKERTLA
jgi:hypothetical protein